MERYWYADEKQQIAKNLGFSSIKSAIISLYRRTGSGRDAGKPFGLTGEAVRKRLKKWNEPRFPPGGDQRSVKRKQSKEMPGKYNSVNIFRRK